MKVGDEFFHRRYINKDHSPALCRVTKVRDGLVFFRVFTDDGPGMLMSDHLDRFDERHIRPPS